MMVISILIGCKRNPNNIEIKNKDLILAIKQFYKDASYYSKGSKNDTISISFERGNDHIKIGLYSFHLLGNDINYIGKAQVDSIKCFFYVMPKEIENIKGLVEIKNNKKQLFNEEINIATDECFCKETYNTFYVYRNGIIEK